MVEIVIDSRELKLKEIIPKDLNLNIEFKNLDLGDIVFKKDNKEILIVERKTINDLYSSIRDGRYKEQKIRLLENYNINQILYIIEDTNNTYKLNKSIIMGAILNMTFRDKIKIVKTKNLNETLEHIILLKKKIEKTPEFFCINNQNQNSESKTETQYLESIKISKKENMNPPLCSIIQLSQIPGVSKQAATIILQEHKSLANLILKYNTLTKEESIILLKDIKMKNRKVGPVLSKRIYEYLFYL